MKRRFEKTVVGLLSVLAMILNTTVFNVATAATGFVQNVEIDGANISFSGKSSVGNEKIDVFLLNDGKTIADLKSADNDADFAATVNYCNVIVSDANGNFSEHFKINNMEDNKQYLLYIKGSYDSYTHYIEQIKRYYVSKNGNDRGGDGSIDNPYATVTKVQSILSGQPRTAPVEVIIGEGVYNLSNSISFGINDSGEEGFPITYKAADNSKVVFQGTTQIDVSKITPVTDSTVLSKLQSSVAGKVVEIDLNQQGIPQSVVNYLSNCSEGISGKPMGVYLNDNPQTIARWPNTGYKTISSVISAGGNTSAGTQSSGGATVKISDVDSTRAARWASASNMYVEGYFAKDWHGEWAKVRSVNSSNLNIVFDSYTHYGVKSGMRIAAVNLLEEIDIPGEWYADPTTMKMYYYPPHTLTSSDKLEIATLCTNFISFEAGASYINIEGIEFAKNADSPSDSLTSAYGGNGILISAGVSNVTIKDCILRDIGMDGIITYGSDITIDGCTIFNTGFSGIDISSGNRTTLTSGNTVISNCIISKVCRDTGANGRAGIVITGVGTLVENNIFSDIPNAAIRYSGNNHTIRYNEIYNTVNKTADAGAIYAGNNFTNYGTVVKNNYFHDIGAGLSSESAEAMFWDDLHSGNTFIGNIIDMKSKSSTTGVKIGGGRDNSVLANIIVNAVYGVRGQDRTVSLNTAFYSSKPFQTFKEAAVGVDDANNITNSNWNDEYISSYPNIKVNFNQIKSYKTYKRAETIKNNVIYNCTNATTIDSNMSSNSTISGNVTSLSASDFVNAGKGDYRIKSSRKSALGLSSDIPDENMTAIGLKNGYTMDADVAQFSLVYPADNMNIASNQTVLVWERSPFADSYTYEVATDSGFTNIVASGSTQYTTASVSGLNASEYFWRVKATNNSSQIGGQYLCEKTFRFTTVGEMVIGDITYDSVNERISYTVSNTKTSGQETFTVIAAIKTASGKLTSIRAASKTVDANTNRTYNISAAFEDDDVGTVVEFYIWDSLGGMKNLIDKRSFAR